MEKSNRLQVFSSNARSLCIVDFDGKDGLDYLRDTTAADVLEEGAAEASVIALRGACLR